MLISPISMYNTQARVSFGSTYSRNFDDTIHFDPVDDNDEGFHTRYSSPKGAHQNSSANGTQRRSTASRPQHANSQDNAQRSQEGQQTKVSRATKRRRRATALALTAAMLTGGHFAATTIFPPSTAIVINVDENQTIDDIAKIYDVPVEILTSYNHVSEDATNQAIAIPEEFDYLQEQIEDIQDKLYVEKLEQTERNKYEAEIVKLKEKQAKQKEIATVYTDGSWVYYKINESTSAPEFRELFDLKPGALSNHNDLPCTWEKDQKTGSTYKNYESAILNAGHVYKVRERDIIGD